MTMKIISATAFFASIALIIYGFTQPNDHWLIAFGIVLSVATLWGLLEFFIADKKENLMPSTDR